MTRSLISTPWDRSIAPRNLFMAAFLQVADVGAAQKTGVGHDYGLRKAESLLQSLYYGDHCVPLVYVARMELVAYGIAARADQQPEHNLGIGVLAVF